MVKAALLAAALLAGCSTPPVQPAPPALDSPPGTTSVLCTLVSTLTTTVRTVLLQVGADAPAGTVDAGSDCSIKVTRK
jgi:hypothetical protein